LEYSVAVYLKRQSHQISGLVAFQHQVV